MIAEIVIALLIVFVVIPVAIEILPYVLAIIATMVAIAGAVWGLLMIPAEVYALIGMTVLAITPWVISKISIGLKIMEREANQ